MILTLARNKAVSRTRFLLNYKTSPQVNKLLTNKQLDKNYAQTKLGQLLYQANLNFSVSSLIYLSIFFSCLLAALGGNLLSLYFVPIFFVIGFRLPFSFVQKCADQRARLFAIDYPPILLATASSIKVGMTPIIALERSINLLPANNIVRLEVCKLLESLRQGKSKETAIAEFGLSIRLPELELFRSAFFLVLEHGGRFSPTLERLAKVTRDRTTLISSARVNTSTMRMTANLLLCISPFIVLMVASRFENYWDLFLHHPMANILGSTGIVVITVSYMILRSMSNFKP